MKRTACFIAAMVFGCSMLVSAPGSAWSAQAPRAHVTSAGKAPSIVASQPGLRPLTIQTVPAVPGARFALDGLVLVTGKDGAVRTVVSKAQRDELALNRDAHLTVASPTVAIRTGVRAQFAGWYDGGYHFGKANPSGQLLLAAFDLEYLTTLKFVDGNGAPVVSVPLSDLVLHSSTGATLTLNDPTTPVWLRGVRVASSSGHLAVDDLSYTVSSLNAKGNNVVRKGEQRFRPGRDAEVTIRSLFFSVQFRAHDAFFGRSAGSELDLQYADGSVQRLPLHDGQVTVPQLPRGTYAIHLRAFGLNENHSISISRSQTVSLPVVSLLDIVVVVAIALAIAAALVLLALSRRRGRLAARSKQTPVDAPEPQPSRPLTRV